MAFEVVLPRLGWNMEEGTLTGWRKKDGDTVTAGDILFEVESDKAIQGVEALESGILRIPSDSPPVGTTLPVGTVIAYLLQPGEHIPDSPKSAQAPSAPVPPAQVRPAQVPPAQRPAAPARAAEQPRDPGLSAAAASSEAARPHARKHPAISPRAKRAATELGVDWPTLRGTGSSGRIVERDVRQAAGTATPAARAAWGSSAGVRQPISAVRRLISERMSESARTAAPVTLTTEADATELVRLRDQLAANRAPVVPSYNDLMIKVAAHALLQSPELNARIEQDSIVQSTTVNIGVAVDTERGLVVPVVRDAQSKTLAQVARETADLVQRARSGHLRQEEMQGGTFSITNLGMYEIDAFTPIVNLPECAILGVGRITARQIVVDAEKGQLAIRRMVFLSLTFDHRLVDSAPAARFLLRIKRGIESPYLWLAGN